MVSPRGRSRMGGWLRRRSGSSKTSSRSGDPRLRSLLIWFVSSFRGDRSDSGSHISWIVLLGKPQPSHIRHHQLVLPILFWWYTLARANSILAETRSAELFVDSKTAPQNIQDAFLNLARRERTTVTIDLVNGAKLQGRIRSFDKFSLMLESGTEELLIFKHAISTVSLPGRASGDHRAQPVKQIPDTHSEQPEEPAIS